MAICISLFCFLVISAGDVDRPRVIRDYTQRGVAQLNIGLPETALSIDDLDRWSHILLTSAAQDHAIRALYERFVERHNELMEREAPAHMALSTEAARIMHEHGIDSREFNTVSNELDQSAARLRRQLMQIEVDYMDSLESLLTPEQADSLATLRLEAAMRYCRIVPLFGPWMNVDLREVWNASAIEIASPEDTAHVRMILTEFYEPRLTALHCNMLDAAEHRRKRLRELLLAAREGRISPAERRDRYERYRYRTTAAAIVGEMVTLYERVVAMIVEGISEPAARAFIPEVKQAAFPWVYPDPDDVRQPLRERIDGPRLSESVQAALRAILDEHTVAYERLHREIEAFCVEWWDRAEQRLEGYLVQNFDAALEPWLDKRKELRRSVLDAYQAVLGEDAFEPLQPVAPTH